MARASAIALRVGREGFVGRLDLVRMDQRLAVETHALPPPRIRAQTLGIAEVVDDAVERDQSAGARRDHHLHQQRHEVAPVRRDA